MARGSGRNREIEPQDSGWESGGICLQFFIPAPDLPPYNRRLPFPETPMSLHLSRISAALWLALPLMAAPTFGAVKKSAPARAAAAAPVELELVHELGEDQGAQLQKLVDRFNADNAGTKLVLSQRDWRKEGALPTLLLLKEDSEARFLVGKPRYRPLWQVMKEAKQPLDTLKPPPQMSPSTVDAAGHLIGLPVGLATPVMFYNKDAFKKVGLDAENPPKTWFDLQGALGKLYAAGYACPYVSASTRWVHVENTDAWHNEAFAGARGNGLTINGLLNVKHLAMMSSWVKARYMHVGGRGAEGDARFASGECPVITTASSAWPAFVRGAKFSVGVSSLPYHDDVREAPRNTLAKGPGLWVGTGHTPAEYAAAARFVRFLLQPASQVEVQRDLGFLPLNKAGLLAVSSELLKDDLAQNRVAVAQLRNKPVTDSSRATRLADNRDVDDIIDEELEALWADKKPAKEVVDTAVARANRAVPPTAVAKGKR